MKAVIVAAGLSTRMFPLKEARNKPKCVLPINGEPIICRTVRLLEEIGFDREDICIVVGYKQNYIRELVQGCTFVFNPFYEYCNNMASMWFAKDFVDDDFFMYLHSDLVFDREIIEGTYFLDNDYMFIEEKDCDEEDMKVSVTEDGRITLVSKDIKPEYVNGEWIGAAVFNPDIFVYCECLLVNGQLNDYDAVAITYKAQHNRITAWPVYDKWTEIDFPEEYELANKIDWR